MTPSFVNEGVISKNDYWAGWCSCKTFIISCSFLYLYCILSVIYKTGLWCGPPIHTGTRPAIEIDPIHENISSWSKSNYFSRDEKENKITLRDRWSTISIHHLDHMILPLFHWNLPQTHATLLKIYSNCEQSPDVKYVTNVLKIM